MPALDIPFFGTLDAFPDPHQRVVHHGDCDGGGPGASSSASFRTLGHLRDVVALVLVAVCVLAYAFQVHDFRIRYVARYSDRSMPWWYLGCLSMGWARRLPVVVGVSCSLGYTFFATRWLRGRYIELQPWILATLMSILIFFMVLMLFAANPFATYIRTTPGDGEGTESACSRTTGWRFTPRASTWGSSDGPYRLRFSSRRLITGRLGNEWVRAARLWSMIAWTFLISRTAPRLPLVLRGAWVGRLLGVGTPSRTPRSCHGSSAPRICTRS